jgi:pterin-4a-carbinolamine dehydratase
MAKKDAAAPSAATLRDVFAAEPEDDVSEDDTPEKDDDSPADAPTKDSDYTDEEQRAIDMGWNPEYDGEDAVTAKEFIARGSFFKKIKSQNQTITKQSEKLTAQEKQIQFLMERNKVALKVGYEKAVAELKAQKREALRDQDFETADAIDDKITQTKEDFEEASSKMNELAAPADEAEDDPDAEVKALVTQQIDDFRDKHTWYDEENDDYDAEMAEVADGIGRRYLREHGKQKDVSKVLAHIEKRMAEIYPQKFEKAPARNKQRQRVEGGGRRAPTRQARGAAAKYTIDDLDSDERSIVKSMVRSGQVKSEEEYIQQLADTGYFN